MNDDRYILVNRKAVPATKEEWARGLAFNERLVGATKYGDDVRVSTVFLGLNHRYSFLGDGPPLIFETMIFGGPHDQYQERCSTWEEAEEMHRAACALVETGK